MCFHRFVDGFGIMEDALVCAKCNHSGYFENFLYLWFYKLLGRVVKNDGTFGHFASDKPPHVKKYDRKITSFNYEQLKEVTWSWK